MAASQEFITSLKKKFPTLSALTSSTEYAKLSDDAKKLATSAFDTSSSGANVTIETPDLGATNKTTTTTPATVGKNIDSGLSYAAPSGKKYTINVEDGKYSFDGGYGKKTFNTWDEAISAINSGNPAIPGTEVSANVNTGKIDYSGLNSVTSEAGQTIVDAVQSALGEVNKGLTNVNTSLGDLRKGLGTTTDVLNKKFEIANQKVADLGSIRQKAFSDQQTLIEDIKSTGNEQYSKILENISKQSNQIESTFSDMRNNLSEVESNYKKIADFQKASTGAAVEKRLLAQGGKSAVGRIANALGEVNMAADKNYADLQLKLAEGRNSLESQYLTLKNAIMSDTNIAEANKLSFSTKIDELLSNLSTTAATKTEALIGEQYKPVEETIGQASNVAIKTVLEKLATTWSDTPEKRDSIVQNLITSQFGKISIPADMVTQFKNAPTLTEGLRLLNNYVKTLTPTATTSAYSNKINTLLSAVSE